MPLNKHNTTNVLASDSILFGVLVCTFMALSSGPRSRPYHRLSLHLFYVTISIALWVPSHHHPMHCTCSQYIDLCSNIYVTIIITQNSGFRNIAEVMNTHPLFLCLIRNLLVTAHSNSLLSGNKVTTVW